MVFNQLFFPSKDGSLGNLLANWRWKGEEMWGEKWEKGETIMVKGILAKSGWRGAAIHGLMECARIASLF
jgi:hypothetical protein